MTDELTAAVARLRDEWQRDDCHCSLCADLRTVLAALETAQADAKPAPSAEPDWRQRAVRAEAERDALRECVKAADAMALECRRVGLISSTWLEDYDDARAKVTLP